MGNPSQPASRGGNGGTQIGFPPASATEIGASSDDDPQPTEKVHVRERSASPNDSVVVEDVRVSELPEIGGESPWRLEPGTVVRAARTFADLPAGTLVGEYEIERKIGEGGMGAVYSAIHPILGKRVAIKIIGEDLSRDANAIARFRREARAVAQLASPHIVDVFGFGELPDGRTYFVMEFLVGESLRDRLARGRVPLDEAVEYLDQVTRGLEAAHEAGIVHRDLKPENIFIERPRSGPHVVKLVDFGIVKTATHDDQVARTQSGVMFGTPLYCSPEQLKSAGTVDHRTDIYALGCVAYELVVGRVPFDRSTIVEVVAAQLECAPPTPRSIWPNIPAALDALLFAMVAKDPAKRPPLGHVQEVIEKLRHSANASGSMASSPASAPEPPMMKAPVAAVVTAPVAPLPSSRRAARAFRPWPMRRVALIVGGVAGALSIIVAIVVVASSDDNEPSSASRSPGAMVPTAHDAGAIVSTIPAPMPEADQHEPTTDRVATTSPTNSPPPMKSRSPEAMRATGIPPIASQPARSPAGRPAVAARPTTGELAVVSVPSCEIAIDGKPTGLHTPVTSLTLPVGKHKVTLTNDRRGIQETVTVEIAPGKREIVSKSYSDAHPPVDPNAAANPFGNGAR